MRKSNIALAVLSALPLLAHADHDGTVHVDAVEVVAQKHSPSTTQPDMATAKETLAKTAGGTTLVDMAEVREGRMSNYQDTLGMAAGVYIQSRFGSEESRLSMRGSGLQRTFHGRGLKLMQDGIPVNLADGSFDFPAVDPYAADYIEVYRGANALQYGASNLGGSINYISPTGYTAPKFEARSEIGSYGYQRLGIRTGGVIDNLDYFLTASEYSQGSYRNDANQSAQRINGNIGYKINDQIENRFYFGYTSNDSELPGNLTKENLKNHPKWSQNQADPGNPILAGTGVWERNIDLWRLANKTTFIWENTKLDVGVFYSNKDLYHPIVDLGYLSFLPFPPFSTGTYATLGLIDQKTDDYGVNVRLQHEGNLAGYKHQLVFGISPTYGETRDRRYRNVNARKGALTNDFALTAYNLDTYIQDSVFLTDSFTVIGGVQYSNSTRRAKDKFIDVNRGDESYDQRYHRWSPKLGAIYQVTSAVQLYGNISRSFEPPSFGELVDPSVAATLKAQTGTTYEIGTRGTSEFVDWDVAVYTARIQNEMLAVSPFVGNSTTINADKTVHTGLEASTAVRLPYHINWRSSLLINDFKLDGDNTFGNNQLPGIQRSLLRSEMLYRGSEWIENFYIGPTIEWSPQKYYADFANTLYADRYFIWGLKAGQKVNNHWSWFVEGRNLGNQTYAASVEAFRSATEANADLRRFLPGDGRTAYAGITWTY